MMNLVVIDDERIVVEWIQTVIARAGKPYQVIGSAASGIRGLAVIRQKRPDIVVTDIRIPGLDGLALIEETMRELPETAFIVISGYQDFEYAKRALRLQVLDYIDKPLNQEKLFSALERAEQQVLQKRSLRTALDQGSAAPEKQRLLCARITEEFSEKLQKASAREILAYLERALAELAGCGILLDKFKDECAKNIYIAAELLHERLPDCYTGNIVPYGDMKHLRTFDEVLLYTCESVRELASDLERPASCQRDIRTLLNYIDTHYTQDIGLTELADLAQMSPAHLSLYFKEKAGMSYIKYLTKVRIDKAKELLAQGRKPSEISELVGYNDYRYFSQVFKKREHMTPNEYREKHWHSESSSSP